MTEKLIFVRVIGFALGYRPGERAHVTQADIDNYPREFEVIQPAAPAKPKPASASVPVGSVKDNVDAPAVAAPAS